MDIVEAESDFDVLKEGHPEDGVNEHDEKEEEGDVAQGSYRHHQGEEQCPNEKGTLDFRQTKLVYLLYLIPFALLISRRIRPIFTTLT